VVRILNEWCFGASLGDFTTPTVRTIVPDPKQGVLLPHQQREMMGAIGVPDNLMKMVAHRTESMNHAFFFELRGMHGRFVFKASFETLKVHMFEMVGLEVKLFIVATPVEMNFAIEGIELLGTIDSHVGGVEANCVTR
jgi:hypothetical protein